MKREVKVIVFFTSDLHFGHENIADLCHRPYKSIFEMDEALIENWNEKVNKNDVVYIVGDIVIDKRKLPEYIERLSGKKILVVGNHDEAWCKREELKAYFEEVTPYLRTNLNSHPITLCHYPMLEWHASREKNKRKLGYLVHGHIHNRVSSKYDGIYRQFNALNAGVDVNGYAPVTFDELVANNLAFKLTALASDSDRMILLDRYNECFGEGEG